MENENACTPALCFAQVSHVIDGPNTHDQIASDRRSKRE